MGLKNPTDSLRKPGEGVGANGMLTGLVERRTTYDRKLGVTV